MAKDSKYVLARSLNNGGTYLIGVSLIKKYPLKWEVISSDVKEDNVEEMDYFELKAVLTELNMPFKGNASKAELVQLYRSANA